MERLAQEMHHGGRQQAVPGPLAVDAAGEGNGAEVAWFKGVHRPVGATFRPQLPAERPGTAAPLVDFDPHAVGSPRPAQRSGVCGTAPRGPSMLDTGTGRFRPSDRRDHRLGRTLRGADARTPGVTVVRSAWCHRSGIAWARPFDPAGTGPAPMWLADASANGRPRPTAGAGLPNPDQSFGAGIEGAVVAPMWPLVEAHAQAFPSMP